MALKRDEVILELIRAGAVQESQVAEAEAIIRSSIETGQQALAGIAWILNQSTRKLVARSYPDGKDLYNLSLPGNSVNLEGWEASGTHITLFHPETCKKVEQISWAPGNEIQLIKARQGLFVGGDFLSQNNLPLTDRYLTQAKPRGSANQGPLDLFFGKEGRWLAVADRGAGQVHMVDLEAQSLFKSFTVRSPGSSRGLNLALDEQARQLIVADSTSSLGVWSFEGEQQAKLSPGAGLLGNLVLAPDLQTIFTLATKPTPGLKVLNRKDGSLLKDIAIKGDLYSVDSDAPNDLMALTPDGNNLLFMTYLNDPEPFTPVISVVDIAKQKTTQRFSIKDGSRPSLLTFMEINPLAAKNKSLVDLLLSLEMITPDSLHTARIAVRERASVAAQEAVPVQTMDLDQRAFEEAQREKEETEERQEDAQAQAEGGFKPEKAPQMNISPVADELIASHCCQIIFNESRGEIDLQKNPDFNEQLERLKAAAIRARNEIEWHTGAVIRLKDFINGKTFEAIITREQLELMLHKHERDSLVKVGMPTVPANCPNCSKPLFGSYVCTYCGYEIERPEELLKRGLVSIATAKPLDNLIDGHFLLIDIEGKRVLEIDLQRNIAWSMGKDILTEGSIELTFPRDVVRLANRNTLITDYSQNRIIEITPSGRLFWEYNGRRSEENRLHNPVRATANGLNHILIADQGRQRILEVNKDSEILLQYGQPDTPGISDGYLNMPSDVQRLVNGNILITDTGNHRVIELEDWKIIWQYGNPENLESGGYGSDPGFLSYPQSALRLDNGHTLIVDAGNLRLLEVNPEGQIVFEHKTNEGLEEHQMDSPFRAAYTPSGMIMALSETAVMEIDPKDSKVVWSCQLSEFERAKVVLKAEAQTKRFMRHGVRNPYFKVKDEDASDESQAKLQELIAKRMASGRSPANANKAHVTTFSTLPLQPLDFFLVDRGRGRILQIDREGQISWRYGEQANEQLNKPHACTRTPAGHALISDTDGHQIIEVDPKTSEIVWRFGKTGFPAVGNEGLNRPRSAQVLANGNLLIVDQNNRRVFELTRAFEIVWSFEGMDNLMAPYHAERLASGNTLISDWGAHIVFEINPEGETVWKFGERKVSGNDGQHLSYPEHAVRLATGNTLITDTRNDRVIEVSPQNEIVWELKGSGEIKFGSPTYARRLKDNHTLVIHSSNRQMLEVDKYFKLYWKFMLPFERPASKPVGSQS